MDDDVLRCPACRQLASEPLLLSCLHSCCRSCIDSCAETGSQGAARCPECREVTLTTDMKENAFVAAGVRACKMSTSNVKCSTCSDKGYPDVAARLWCNDCCKALCDSCESEHRIHVASHEIVALLDALSSNLASTAMATLCQPHGRACDLVCLQCRSTKCSTCVKTCRDQLHQIEHRRCKTSTEIANTIAGAIQKEVEMLEHKCAGFDSRKDVLRELLESQKSHTETLQRNKRFLLNAVDKAFQEAEDFLREKYAQLREKASALADASRQLSVRSRAAISYGKFVLQSQDIGTLLHHEQLLLSRLQHLVTQMEALPQAERLTKCISIDSVLPQGVEHYCRTWIGVPRVELDHDLNPGQAHADQRSNSGGLSTLGFVLDSFSPLSGGFQDYEDGDDTRSPERDMDQTLTGSVSLARDTQKTAKRSQAGTAHPFSRFNE